MLITELKELFEVKVLDIEPRFDLSVPYQGLHYYSEFNREVGEYDVVIIRGDRYEMLPVATAALYNGKTIVHIEGGDVSGVIDNKVRHAITQISDIHFATNKYSYSRLISMGTDPDKTFNFGSLDVEYAKSVPIIEGNAHVLVCFHPIPGENGEAIKHADFSGKQVIHIKSNNDNGKSTGSEEYPSDEYVKLLASADLLVGNSSSFLKEASIFGTPVVLVGERQNGRLLPRNVMKVPHNRDAVRVAVEYQMNHGRYKPDNIYYQPNTSKHIAQKLKELL
jgi:UDP-hydrolysing UDP-N-acetyl-D-glucosamine 2-epimerase